MAEFIMKALVQQTGRTDEISAASKAMHTDEIGSDMHYGTYDYIVGMDRENMRDLDRLTGGDPAGKTYKLLSFIGERRDVADPWYTGDFETTYRDVNAGCRALLAQICSESADT